MPGARISAKRRDKIYDTLHRYVWSMDTGDIDGVIGCFTEDGEVKDVSGKRWDASEGGATGFANHYLNRPNRAGAQHWIQPMLIEEAEGGYVIKSYWHSIKWETNPDRRFIRTIGVYTDTVVKGEGRLADPGKGHRLLEQRDHADGPRHPRGGLDTSVCRGGASCARSPAGARKQLRGWRPAVNVSIAV